MPDASTTAALVAAVEDYRAAAEGRGVGRLLNKHMIRQAWAAGPTEVRVVCHPPAEDFQRKAPAGIGPAGAFRCTACSVKGEKTITSRATVRRGYGVTA